MTNEANICVEILRKAARYGVMDCSQHCPAYSVCPTGTAGWNNECMFETAADLIESLSAELEQVENKLSELLYYTTGGRYSKAEYSTDDMRRFVDDYFQSVCSECDELEQAELERDAAVQDLNACCPCEVCTRSCTYDKVNAYDECADFQWRGPGGEQS